MFTTPEDRTRSQDELRIALADLVARQGLSMVFQPIVGLQDGEICGYEALTRPDRSSGFANADDLFEAAQACEMLEEVEGVSRRAALREVAEAGEPAILFVNNSPKVFTGDHFKTTILDEVEAVGLRPDQVVLEITERNEQRRMDDLGVRALMLREEGFTVALDDVGAGVSGLNQIMSLRPNWLKIDRELVADIDYDPLKQNLMRFFVQFAKLGNMRLVAEGIERAEELAVLMRIGVTHGQGYFLARPGKFGAPLGGPVKEQILELRRGADRRDLHDASTVRLGSLADPVMTCDVKDTIGEAAQRLRSMSHQEGFAVLDRCRYLGWLSRDSLSAQRKLFHDQDLVGALSHEPSPLVGHDFTLAEAMEIIAARPEGLQTLPLLVQRNGVAVGLLSLRQVLLAAAESQRRAPSHIAPLTGLPSRVQADRWIANRIKAGDPSDIAFIDLRDFDAYNLAYGFDKGDEMLMKLVELVNHRPGETHKGGATFFAHLGEDRFMLAFPYDARAELLGLIDEFEASWSQFFASADMAAEAYRCDDPFGRSRTFPLTTLRVVYLPRGLQGVAEPRELHDLANRLRLRSRRDGPARSRELIIDRRQPPAAGRRSA